jgi:hypothetical protein
MKYSLLRLAPAIALTSLLSTASAQDLEDGYGQRVLDLPSDAGQVLDLGAAQVYFTGTDLVLAKNSTKRSLLQFSKSVFGSFTIRIAPDTLLFGESSDGSIWRVPLSANSLPKQLGSIALNYSAVLYSKRWAIISAKTGGFSATTNDLIAINLMTGAQDPIAAVPGASGPIAVDGKQDLYYATASLSYPPPPGFSDVVKFSAAKIQSAFGSTQLAISDASVLVSGIDAAGSLALDNDDDLFLTDWVNSNIVEISDVNGTSPRRSTLGSYASASVTPGGLQFVAGNNSTSKHQFEPFQTLGAGRLIVHESSFGTISRLRNLIPMRATTESSVGNKVSKATAFDLVVKNGMTAGTGFLILGLGRHTRESDLAQPFEAPIFWSSTLLQPILITPINFDSHGEAKLSLYNPGFAQPLALTSQAYFETGVTAGSSKPLTIGLQ